MLRKNYDYGNFGKYPKFEFHDWKRKCEPQFCILSNYDSG